MMLISFEVCEELFHHLHERARADTTFLADVVRDFSPTRT